MGAIKIGEMAWQSLKKLAPDLDWTKETREHVTLKLEKAIAAGDLRRISSFAGALIAHVPYDLRSYRQVRRAIRALGKTDDTALRALTLARALVLASTVEMRKTVSGARRYRFDLALLIDQVETMRLGCGMKKDIQRKGAGMACAFLATRDVLNRTAVGSAASLWAERTLPDLAKAAGFDVQEIAPNHKSWQDIARTCVIRKASAFCTRPALAYPFRESAPNAQKPLVIKRGRERTIILAPLS